MKKIIGLILFSFVLIGCSKERLDNYHNEHYKSFKFGDKVETNIGRIGTVVSCATVCSDTKPATGLDWRIKFEDGEIYTLASSEIELVK